MKKQILFKKPYFYGILLFIFLIKTWDLSAQCAGSEVTLTICEKDGDTAYMAFPLFSQLGGSPTPGGVWSTPDPTNFDALDEETGIVNLWKINTYGEHTFTYTNADCNESAVVTILLGGYPGEDNTDGSANACADNPAVNLNIYIGSSDVDKIQDFNGIWTETTTPNSGQLLENIFNAQGAGPGVYTFEYTVEAVDTCPERTVRLELEIHRPPRAGTSNNLRFCTTDDFSAYTNVNLFDYLNGADNNGIWSEGFTNQLDGLLDSFINIEEINDRFGPGSYEFEYTINDAHPTCLETSATVTINISNFLRGTTTSSPACAGNLVVVDLQYDETLLLDGDYEVTYEITGQSAVLSDSQEITFEDGRGQIILSQADLLLNEPSTFQITGILGGGQLGGCSEVDIAPTQVLMLAPQLSAGSSCEGSTNNITIANIFNEQFEPINGSAVLTVNITNPAGSTSLVDDVFVLFNNGVGSFVLDETLLNTPGTYSISVEVPDAGLACNAETTFEVLPIPDGPEFELAVDDGCDANFAELIITAPSLPNGGYNIAYKVYEDTDPNEPILVNTIDFSGGSATYQIDINSFSDGNYILNLVSTQNDDTPCRTVFEYEFEQDFFVRNIPDAPVVAEQQVFCTVIYPNGPTIADIEVQSEGNARFYATETATEQLTPETLLVDGGTYYVGIVNSVSNCESVARSTVEVFFFTPEMVSITDANPQFCATEEVTLSELLVNAPNGGDIVWHASETGGDPLPSDTALVDNTTYFASEEVSNGCASSSRLAITPAIIAPPEPDLVQTVFEGCSLDNPTLSELIALEIDHGESVRWFSDDIGGEPLTADTPLVHANTYYAESFSADNGCINPDRIGVAVDLEQCDPDAFEGEYFVPNAFSPNGDGMNDTFYIPNAAAIFPDYSFEVYNRYGALVFEGNAQRPSWDGRHNGKDAPNGIYFFILNFNREGYDREQHKIILNR